MPIVLVDSKENKLLTEEVELRRLINVYRTASKDPREQYQFLSILSAILNQENKTDEAKDVLTKVISIAELPNSFPEDLPTLYERMGNTLVQKGNMSEASVAFTKALEQEKDKGNRGYSYLANMDISPKMQWSTPFGIREA